MKKGPSKEKARTKKARRRPEAPRNQARIVSWNVHGAVDAPRRSERIETIARVVIARSPDFVLLQEVWQPSDANLLIRAFGRRGLSVIDVPGGSPTQRAGLLSFANATSGWRSGSAVFHKFRPESRGWKFWQHKTRAEPGALGFSATRDELPLAVWNAHVPADPSGDDAEPRKSWLAELSTAVSSGSEGVALIAGDLGTTPDEAAFAELAGFEELTRTLRERCGCGTRVEAAAGVRWLDYLVARAPAGWRVSAEVSLLRNLEADKPYSDHQGLDSVVKIERPRSDAALAWLAAAALAPPTTRRELLARLVALTFLP